MNMMKTFSILLPAVVMLAACNPESTTGAASSSVVGFSGPATLLDGTYKSHANCSDLSFRPPAMEACQRSSFEIRNGVGSGVLYQEGFDEEANRGVYATLTYHRVDFSDVVNGKFNARADLTHNIFGRSNEVAGGEVSIGSRGTVETVTIRVPQASGSYSKMWWRVASSGETVGDQELQIARDRYNEAIERENRQRQATTEFIGTLAGVATGVAVGLSGAEASPELGRSTSQTGGLSEPPLTRAENCVNIFSVNTSGGWRNYTVNNRCSYGIIFLYCDANDVRCPVQPVSEMQRGRGGATYSTARIEAGGSTRIENIRQLRHQSIVHYVYSDTPPGYCRVVRNNSC